jgi:hypothetical protein
MFSAPDLLVGVDASIVNRWGHWGWHWFRLLACARREGEGGGRCRDDQFGEFIHFDSSNGVNV